MGLRWTDLLALALLLLTLPGTLYLCLLSLAATRGGRRAAPAHDGATPPRVAFVVPAHNEGRALLRTLDSLRAACAGDPHASIHVVADNCSDDTAAVARGAGVQVLERHDAARRGKGYALEYAFERIADADWFVVIDADTDVEAGFLPAMRARMRAGTDALQCRYLVRDALQSRRGTLAEVAWAAWNVLRPRGRAALGLSTGILGNGFALPRATLARMPYTARSIVEDVEYHLLLVRAGMRVRWVDDAVVRGDMPATGAAAGTQRARWEGGRLRLALDQGPALAAQVLRGRLRLLDPLADLLLLPLAPHVALLAGAAGAAAPGSPALLGWALAALGVVALHVLLGLVLIRARGAHWRALLGVPAYIVWKLLLTARIARSAGRRTEWVRTERRPAEKGDTP
jgi:hypothetical protein